MTPLTDLLKSERRFRYKHHLPHLTGTNNSFFVENYGRVFRKMFKSGNKDKDGPKYAVLSIDSVTISLSAVHVYLQITDPPTFF